MNRVIDFVINATLCGESDGLTVREIAGKLDISQKRVRSQLEDERGHLRDKRIERQFDWRTSYSTNYKHIETGVHRVTVYRMTRHALLEIAITKGETA